MKHITMEQQHETLLAAARGYLMLAMALKEAGYEEGFVANMKREVECFNKALELQAKIEELNCLIAA